VIPYISEERKGFGAGLLSDSAGPGKRRKRNNKPTAAERKIPPFFPAKLFIFQPPLVKMRIKAVRPIVPLHAGVFS
jgi:hypothetical protein